MLATFLSQDRSQGQTGRLLITARRRKDDNARELLELNMHDTEIISRPREGQLSEKCRVENLMWHDSMWVPRIRFRN